MHNQLRLKKSSSHAILLAMDHPGEVTKLWRKQRKLSIPRLAELSGIDKGTISRFERGGDYRKRIFEAICSALQHDVREVYAILAGDISGAAVYDPHSMLCENKAHRILQTKLDAIMHANQRMGELVAGTISEFYKTLGNLSLPIEGQHGPFADLTAPSGTDIIEAKREPKKKRFGH